MCSLWTLQQLASLPQKYLNVLSKQRHVNWSNRSPTERCNYLLDSMEAILHLRAESAPQEDFPLLSYRNRHAYCRYSLASIICMFLVKKIYNVINISRAVSNVILVQFLGIINVVKKCKHQH